MVEVPLVCSLQPLRGGRKPDLGGGEECKVTEGKASNRPQQPHPQRCFFPPFDATWEKQGPATCLTVGHAYSLTQFPPVAVLAAFLICL